LHRSTDTNARVRRRAISFLVHDDSQSIVKLPLAPKNKHGKLHVCALVVAMPLMRRAAGDECMPIARSGCGQDLSA
jgi:hypothetical protein